jgi:hypothetical protein
MLHSLFPQAHCRFFSLPLLGPVADGFDDWLAANGYTRVSRTNSIRMLPHVDAELRRRQVKEVANLTQPVLRACLGDSPQGLSLWSKNRADIGTISGRERLDR